MDRAVALDAEFLNATKDEAGMLYWGFVRAGNKQFCRESYADAAGALAHLGNVGAILGKGTDERIFVLDRLDVYGPAAELDKLKADGGLKP